MVSVGVARRVAVPEQLVSRVSAAAIGGLVAIMAVAVSAVSVAPAAVSRSGETARTDQSVATSSAATGAAQQAYGHLPLAFEPNVGQTDLQVRYVAHGSGYAIFLTAAGAVWEGSAANSQTPTSTTRSTSSSGAVQMRFAGGNPQASLTGGDRQAGVVNYLVGARTTWHTNVPTFASVTMHNVYPGVDVVWHGSQGTPEYDLVVAPGADPSSIGLEFTGSRSVAIDSKSGDLIVATGSGYLHERAPHVYQTIDGAQRDVAGHFAVTGGVVRLAIGTYDHSVPLVVDPVLSYSTYLGGSVAPSNDGFTQGDAVTVDATGAAYVVGETGQQAFPTTPGAAQSSHSGSHDAFVSKFNTSASGAQSLVYSTFLGGTGNDAATAIAVDTAGDAYVAGTTASLDFPTTEGAFQRSTFEQTTGFVIKLNAAGSTLLYSTYLGATSLTLGTARNPAAPAGIALDAAGDAVVVGSTYQPTFPTTPGAFQTTFPDTAQNHTGFVSKVNPSGTGLVYSTFLGGSVGDALLGVALDGTGDAYVAGSTNSTDYPTTPGAFQTTCSLSNCAGPGEGAQGVVTKLNASGTGLVYSTYTIGDTANADATAIAVDASGDAFITGGAGGSGFATSGALQTSCPGTCAMAMEFASGGASLRYATFLGGSGDDAGSAIALDAAGDAFVAGSATSQDFPVTPGAFQTSKLGGSGSSGFVSKVNPAGSALLYSTYITGSSGSDTVSGLALDTTGRSFVTGGANSSDFPTTPNALMSAQPAPSASGFVTQLNAAGSALVYSTYLGGPSSGGGYPNSDTGNAIAVDSSGSAYVTGTAGTFNFPVVAGGVLTTPQPSRMVFVTKFNAQGSGLVYSTYISASGKPVGIAVDGAGDAYVAGGGSINPTAGAYQAAPGPSFLARLNTDGSGFVYATYFPASVTALALGPGGSAYLVARVSWAISSGAPTPFPATAGSYEPACPHLSIDSLGRNVCTAGALSRVDATGSTLLYSTYFDAVGAGVAVDSAGVAYITGSVVANGLSPTAGAFQTINACTCTAAFLSIIAPNGHGSADLGYASYLGGSDRGFGDKGVSVALGPNGTVYVAGTVTPSPNFAFPTTAGAFGTATGCADVGGCNAFLTTFRPQGRGANDLVYSTLYGGGAFSTVVIGLAVDASGRAYSVGFTTSPTFPVTANAPQSFDTAAFFSGSTTATVTELDPSLVGDGTDLVSPTNPAVVFSTFLGGDDAERPSGGGIALSSTGAVYVTEDTDAPCGLTCGEIPVPFPTTPGAFQTECHDCDANGGITAAFVTKIGQLCGTALTGSVHGSVQVGAGKSLCLRGATVHGSIVVKPGGDLTIDSSTISGSIVSNGATSVTVCNSTVGGSVSVSGSTGFVRIGDSGFEEPCLANTLEQGVTLKGNKQGVELGGNTIIGNVVFNGSTGISYNFEDITPEIEANTITGSVSCTGNAQTPINDGQPNTVSGSETGQCAALDAASSSVRSLSPAHQKHALGHQAPHPTASP